MKIKNVYKKLIPLFLLVMLLILLFTNCKKDDDSIYPATVIDADGNIYNTVAIGTQVWMVENLKTTKYRDGTPIPLVTDSLAWSVLTNPGYCWYNNDQATHGNIYGALYNWHAVNTGDLCPSGWHVPTHAEWTILTEYLMGDSIAGNKLKEAGTFHWRSPNKYATNETGFTALPGGWRVLYDGEFRTIGLEGHWWSATQESDGNAWGRMMGFYGPGVNMYAPAKQNGLSIRCLRD